jgi:hypothetical protein
MSEYKKLKFKIENSRIVKDRGSYAFQYPCAEGFEEVGYSPITSANLDYLLNRQLAHHQTAAKYNNDYDVAHGIKTDKEGKKYSEAVINEAIESMKGIYSYSWDTMPKVKTTINWGELKPHVAASVASWENEGIDPTESQIRERAQIIMDHNKNLFKPIT